MIRLLVALLCAALAGFGGEATAQGQKQRDLLNDAYVVLDQAHSDARQRAVDPWRFVPCGTAAQVEVLRLASARELERIINDYEYGRGFGKTDWRIGVLLSDLGAAYGTKATERQHAAVLSAAVRTLAPYVGQDARLDMVYAQAVHRLARRFDRDGSDRAQVARHLADGLQLLRQRRSSAAEEALVEAWRWSFPRASELPGFERVLAMVADQRAGARCPELTARAGQIDIRFKAGRADEARKAAADLVDATVASGNRGCDITMGYDRLVPILASAGRNAKVAELLEAQLRSQARQNPKEWSRAVYTGVPWTIAIIAEHGSVEQLRRTMELAVPFSFGGFEPGMHPAAMARMVADSLAGSGSYAEAELMYDKARELRPAPASGQTGGWGAAEDAIAAALFHEEYGRRSLATDYARIALGGFPAHALKPGDVARARLILARNARDEGDVMRAVDLVAQAARDVAPLADVALLQEVFSFAQKLPPAVNSVLRDDFIAHAGSMLTRYGHDRSTPKVIRGEHVPSMVFALDVAVRYHEKPLFERAKAVSASTFQYQAVNRYPKLRLAGDVAAAWFAQYDEIAPGGGAKKRVNLAESPASLILDRDYGAINRRAKTDADDHSCAFGRIAVMKLVGRERAAGRAPSVSDIDKAVDDNLCAGNFPGSVESQLVEFMNEGLLWLAAGEPQVALRYLQTAVPQLVDGDQGKRDAGLIARDPEAAPRLASLARARFEVGDLAGASAAADRVLALITQRLGASGAGADRQREANRFREPLDLQVAIAAETMKRSLAGKDGDEAAGRALTAMQLSRATATADATARLGARLAASEPAVAGLLRERQDLADLIEREGGRIESADTDEAKLAASRRLAEARRKLEETARQLTRKAPRLVEAEAFAPVTLKELRAALGPGEALLSSHSTAGSVYLLLVTPSATKLIKTDIGREALADLVADLRLGLDIADGKLERFRDDAAILLRQTLILPFAAELAGKTHLTLVVDGPLESLPFAVLAEPPATAGTRPRYLIEQLSLANLPNIRSLVTLRALNPASRGAEPFLGIGDPVLGPADWKTRGNMTLIATRSASERLSQLRQLASLPDTATELRALAGVLKGSADAVWLGPRATEARVKTQMLSQYRIVTFATHALVAGELDGISEPGIVLTPPAQAMPQEDGLLSASEIAALSLNADLVVLSACNTASPNGRPGADGLSGLARAFIAAGARGLVVSHWRVASAATASLIERFGVGLAAGTPPAQALRTAMLGELVKGGDSAHPALWAPFFVVGAGG